MCFQLNKDGCQLKMSSRLSTSEMPSAENIVDISLEQIQVDIYVSLIVHSTPVIMNSVFKNKLKRLAPNICLQAYSAGFNSL